LRIGGGCAKGEENGRNVEKKKKGRRGAYKIFGVQTVIGTKEKKNVAARYISRGGGEEKQKTSWSGRVRLRYNIFQHKGDGSGPCFSTRGKKRTE